MNSTSSSKYNLPSMVMTVKSVQFLPMLSCISFGMGTVNAVSLHLDFLVATTMSPSSWRVLKVFTDSGNDDRSRHCFPSGHLKPWLVPLKRRARLVVSCPSLDCKDTAWCEDNNCKNPIVIKIIVWCTSEVIFLIQLEKNNVSSSRIGEILPSCSRN